MNANGYAQWFRDSTPYISMHRHKTFVVLLPGDAFGHPNLTNIVHDLALIHVLGVRLVIVHGAREEIDRRLPDGAFHRGRRITSESDLPVLLGIFGEQRARLEALFSTGLPTSPLRETEISVIGGNFVTARPVGIVDGVDHLLTGRTRRVHADRLRNCLSADNIVLLSPLGYSPSGQVFNLAADELAADVALALEADKLIVFDREGALRNSAGERISVMTPAGLHAFLDDAGDHLSSVLRASRGGIASCQIVSYSEDGAVLAELFTASGSGTQIRERTGSFIRPATAADVAGIVEVIRPLEDAGMLVRRSRDRLEEEIDHFMVAAMDDNVIGCCAVYPYGDSAELACVAVHPSYRERTLASQRGSTVGASLLAAAEDRARAVGANALFALTTQTRDWFLEQGFTDASTDELPAPKQAMYNYRRNARVMIKALTAGTP
jgi:amino-acid N-acetyltransferase